MQTTTNRSRKFKATIKAILILLSVLLMAQFTTFLLQAAILGLISVLGFHMALSSFPKIRSLILGYKGIIDVIVSLGTLILAIKMGITAAASIAFAGVFFSIYLDIFATNYEKRKIQISWNSKWGFQYPSLSIAIFY